MRTIFLDTKDDNTYTKLYPKILSGEVQLRIPTGLGYTTYLRQLPVRSCTVCNGHTDNVFKDVYEPFVQATRRYCVGFRCRSCNNFDLWEDRQVEI